MDLGVLDGFSSIKFSIIMMALIEKSLKVTH